ncbi:unnamed protein product [Arctia plantaginis]|uniref:Kazal-like domain-containing protein n=1 Tax=Arctia plantaginis TaxID=874455 RepID=A0A8S1AAX5_ARCPL|nr:unnamed protein product [Arctia plantaginis]
MIYRLLDKSWKGWKPLRRLLNNLLVCFPDYEANIVAMKLCEHENIMKIKKTQNSTVTRRGRVKRSIFRRDTTTRVHDVFDSTSSEEYASHKIQIDDIHGDQNSSSIPGKQAGLYLQGHKGEKANKKKGEPLLEEIAPNVFHLFSEETIAERKIAENSDECPDTCPAHTDMICVKYLHGVYKTFPSTCHLRQYCCSNGGESRRENRRTELNEKGKNKRITMRSSRVSKIRNLKDLCKDIELVSRHPCILSVPFIDSNGVTSRGRVYNQNANDVILGYIKCKSLDLLGKSDPRCPF